MGREIRRVPANWEHPKVEKFDPITGTTGSRFKPLYDTSCEEAWAEWKDEYTKWLDGEHDRIISAYGSDGSYPKDQPYTAFCEWNGMPPNPEYYRPAWNEEDMTWIQVYETVSEGTPVTPPFATEDELIDYLVENGDYWDQDRRKRGNSVMDCAPWPRRQAEKFVRGIGWAPSVIVEDGAVKSGVEALYGD